MKEYSLQDLKGSFVKASIFTIVMAILGGGAMFGLAKHKQHLSYTADRYVVISHPITEKSVGANNSMTNIDQQMMMTYEEIAENPVVAKAARQHLNSKLKKEYSVDQISQDVNAKVKPQSLVLRLSATANSPKNAVALVNATAEGFKEVLPQVQTGAGAVKLLSKATTDGISLNKSVNTKKYAAVGLALGGLVGIIISFVVITWKKVLK